MGKHWPVILGCLSIVLSTTHSAVVPTEDTLVITKSDDASSEPPSSTLPESTTEGPLPPVKLLEMHVVSEVTLRYSHTTVTTLVKNPAKRSQETVFRVLLPETAFISGFSMTIDGKKYDAYVKEKEEAKQIYTDAVSQGIGAAHIATKARDSNHFTVSVNVEPNSVALFNLTYEELLSRHNGLYSQSVNLQPGSLVPNMSVLVHIKEAQKITTVRVPEITTGNEITPTDDSAENRKAVVTRSSDDHEVTVVFKPDLDEQKRLMEIFAEKSKESRARTHNSWYQREEEQEPDQGILGQFVVQYEVDRTKGNEVMVDGGYFVHFFAPTDLPPLEKHVVFVLDTSGSMMSRKIEQLREAMQLILGELNGGDYFSIVEFASSVTVHDLKEAEQQVAPPKRNYYYYEPETKPVKLIPPFPATPENIAKAKIIVGRLEADGGTNIAEALDVATDLVHRGVGWKESTVSVNNASKNNASEDTNTDINNMENKSNITLEPMIIFLTDGEPTIGETDPKRIMSRFIEKNYGERKANTFSLAFGDDADSKFLRKLSLNNNGFSRNIYEAADAVLQLSDFYQQVTSPLLAHVKFTYPPNQVKEDSITKSGFRTYYAGSEIVVAGRIDDTATEILPIVSGFCGVDEGFAPRKLYEIRPRIIIKKEKKEYLPLERLWAYLTIKQLLDDRDAAQDFALAKDTDEPKPKKEAPEKKALGLALQYSFVTDLTSLVVVKPNETRAVNAESVNKPEFPQYSGSPQFLPLSIGSLPGAPGPVAFASFVGAPASSHILGNRYGSSWGNSFPQAQLLASADFDEGEQDLIAYDDISTPLTFIDTINTETQSNSSDVYNLGQYPWTRPLLNSSADELVIQVNGTDVHLKLTKDVNAPETLGGAVTCSVSTAGTAGSCVYLTRCEAARNITSDLYSSTYCLVDNQYAGVCCPNVELEASTNTILDTTVPATESNSGHA